MLTGLLKMKQVFETALYFGLGDLKSRYKRSSLGPLWLVFGTFIGVVGLGFVWGTLLKVDLKNFIPSLAVGLIIWQYLSASITESTNIYYRNVSVIKNYLVSLWLFPLQLFFKQIFYFLHNCIVLFAVFLYFDINPGFGWFYSFLGLVLVGANMLWLSVLIGFVATRFRDVEAFILAAMPLLFFISPVLFKPSSLGEYSYIIDFNPLSHFISLIRGPLLGNTPSLGLYVIIAISGVVGLLLSQCYLNRAGRRISYWV